MIAKTFLFCSLMLPFITFFSKCGDAPQQDTREVKYDTAEVINKILNGDSNFHWIDTGIVIIKLGMENEFISSEIIQRNVTPIITDTIYLQPGTDSINVPLGRLHVLVFPDQTKVWLNAGSSMVFSNDNKNGRHIKLYGEGYFEVQRHAKKQQLTIELKGSKCKVVYGKIGINTFDDGPPKASVIEGQIIVVTKNKVFKMTGPGCFQLKDNLPTKYCDPEDANSWTRGFLKIDSTVNCESFYKSLSRWYDVDFNYTAKDKVCQMEGSIPINTSLKNVLKLFETNKIKYNLKLINDRLQIDIK